MRTEKHNGQHGKAHVPQRLCQQQGLPGAGDKAGAGLSTWRLNELSIAARVLGIHREHYRCQRKRGASEPAGCDSKS